MTAETFETLSVAIEGSVARLTLERPERLNSLSRRTLADLAEAARFLDRHRDVRATVVTGRGRAFCAGFDLGDFSNPDPEITMRDDAELGRLMAEAVTGMRSLTIAAVHGHCVGGGLVLAAACDLRIAADDARFSIPEVDLGIPLAWGGIPRLVREIGPALTKELVLTCRPFDAHEAKAAGFVNRVVPRTELDGAVDDLAASLATKPAYALFQTKTAVNAAAEELASTAQSFRDADVLVVALADAESREAGRRYLRDRRR
ncbi:MAG: enoyl-CoA hydratase/isomerase family protein [Acidimicrobiales bacterium]